MALKREKASWRTKAEFARLAGCSPAAITKAVREGRVATINHGTFIDAEDPKNVSYLENCKGRQSREDIVKQQNEEIQQEVARQMSGELEQKRAALHLAQNHALGRGGAPMLPPLPSPASGGDQKVDYEIAKIYASTMKLNADLATTLKKLIKRELVDTVLNRVGTVITEHLLTMGDRMSSDVAAIFESSDPEHTNRIKQLIDKDITRTIETLKRTIREEYEAKVV